MYCPWSADPNSCGALPCAGTPTEDIKGVTTERSEEELVTEAFRTPPQPPPLVDTLLITESLWWRPAAVATNVEAVVARELGDWSSMALRPASVTVASLTQMDVS